MPCSASPKCHTNPSDWLHPRRESEPKRAQASVISLLHRMRVLRQSLAALRAQFQSILRIKKSLAFLQVIFHRAKSEALRFGTPNGNRTHNCPLGGGCYIHLTMQAYSILSCPIKRKQRNTLYFPALPLGRMVGHRGLEPRTNRL